MIDPERLLESDADPQARALLRAAHDEQPSAAALARARQALGLQARGMSLARPELSSLAKWASIFGVGAAVVVGYGTFARERAPLPVERARPAAAAPPAPATAADETDQLRDELLRLERARGSLLADAPGAALHVLDDYDREYARGTLREEALALRVEALSTLGERERTRELARTFLRRYPASVHTQRVRALLAQVVDAR